MAKFLSKLGDFGSKIIDRSLWRYYGAVLTFAFMVILLAYGMNGTIADSYPTAGVYATYEQSQDENLKNLIQSYYSAYASGDTDTLSTLASPISDGEKSYISFFSQYVEEYNSIDLYTKRGLVDGSYLVSSYIEIKFSGIDTPAPGLDFFYVVTGEDGNLIIDNTYSSYNTSNGDYEMDAEIASLIATFEEQEDVLALQAEVQQAFNEAVLKDEKLNNFVNNELQSLTNQWAESYQKEVAEAEAEAAAAAEKAQKEAEEAAAAEQKEAILAAFDAASTTMTTTDKINVRSAADTDSDKLGQLAKGEEVKVVASANGWSAIIYEESLGYVKTEYLKGADASTETSADETDTQDEDTSTEASNPIYEAGEKVTLTNTVNVRESMDTSSKKVAVVYPGESVKVVLCYEEGWTKVTYGSKTGYVKTENLK